MKISTPLCEHLKFVADRVPIYGAVSSLELCAFPLVTKREYRNNYQEYFDSKIPTLRALLDATSRLLETGTSLWKEVTIGQFTLERSSGTSGPPMWYPRSRVEKVASALELSRARSTLNPDFRLSTFLDLQRWLREGSSRPLELETIVERISHAIPRLGGQAHLYGNVSMLAEVAQRLLCRNVKLTTAIIELAGEHANEDQLALLHSVFGAPMISQYGTRESLAIGYAKPPNSEFQLLSSVIVELVDDSGARIDSDGVRGSIAVTSLILKTFPIIRFLTGDYGEWRTVNGFKLLKLDSARAEQTLILGGVRYDGNQFFRSILNGSPVSYCATYEVKIRQKGLTLEVYTTGPIPPLQLLIEPATQQASNGQAKIVYREWPGWEPDAKRYMFLRQ